MVAHDDHRTVTLSDHGVSRTRERTPAAQYSVCAVALLVWCTHARPRSIAVTKTGDAQRVQPLGVGMNPRTSWEVQRIQVKYTAKTQQAQPGHVRARPAIDAGEV